MSEIQASAPTLADYADVCMTRSFIDMAMMQRTFALSECSYRTFYEGILARMKITSEASTVTQFAMDIMDQWVEVDAAWFRRIVYAFEPLDVPLEYDPARLMTLPEAMQENLIRMFDAMPDPFVACYLHTICIHGYNSSLGLSKMCYGLRPDHLHRVLNTYFQEAPVFSGLMWFMQGLYLAQYRNTHGIAMFREWLRIAASMDEPIFSRFCDYIHGCDLDKLDDALNPSNLLPVFQSATQNGIASVIEEHCIDPRLGYILGLVAQLPIIVRDLYDLYDRDDSEMLPVLDELYGLDDACQGYDFWVMHPENPYIQATSYLAREDLCAAPGVVMDTLYPVKSRFIGERVHRLISLVHLERAQHQLKNIDAEEYHLLEHAHGS